TFAGAPSPIVQSFRLVTGAGSSSPTTFPYSGTPVTVPGGDLNGALVPINVTGLNAPIAKVTLAIGGSSCTSSVSTTVGVDTNWIGDFQFFLISPSGTIVALSINSGGGRNLCNTVFDDGAPTPFSSVTQAQNPFTGTFAPASPLSAFACERAT